MLDSGCSMVLPTRNTHDAVKAADSDELLLLERLRGALLVVCPTAVPLLESKSGLSKSLNPDAGGDYTTKIARSAFLRLQSNKRKAPDSSSNNPAVVDDEDNNERSVTISSVSDLGVERVRTYSSPDALALALVAALFENEHEHECNNSGSISRQCSSTGVDDMSSRDGLLADARVLTGGVLVLCTRRHMARQRVRQYLHCADCGGFFNGDRGLRQHQMVKHGANFETAVVAVADQRLQVAVWTQSHGAQASVEKAWQQEHHAELRARDCLGDPGLEAARAGDLAALQALVQNGWDATVATDRHGSSALLWAAGSGHLDVCRFLVSNTCGIRASSLGGPGKRERGRHRNALHWAARNGHLHVVQWLVLEMDVPVDVGTSDGTTPFMYAVWKGHREVCEWLVAPRTSHSDDNGSSGGGGGGGCRFDATNDFGCNAIQWCAQTGDLPMCKWLKQIGLNLGLTNRNGHSAIHKAAVKGQAEICEWLLKPSCNEDGSEDEGGGAGLGLQHLEKDGDGNDPSEMARLEGFGTLAAWLRTETDARRAALDGGA